VAFPRHFEDCGFCKRRWSIGGRVFIVPSIRLKHHGGHAYEGDPLFGATQVAA